MTRIRLPNFTPRAYQRRAYAYFDGGGTRAVTVWHRRAGKDVAALHHTAKRAHQVRGLYWHVFPTAEQGKRAIWTGFTSSGERMLEEVFPRALRKAPREFAPQGEMVVELKCGSVWRLIGSDRMDVVGAGPKGVVFSEYALAKPGTWELVRPMLRESRGWAWFVTTPRGANHAKALYDQATPASGWYRDTQTVASTGLRYASTRLPGTELDYLGMVEEEAAEGMPAELIQQEYYCSWSAADVGSFYGLLLGELEGRGGLGVPFESSGDEVCTSWDLGRADDTAIWWWRLREGSTSTAPRVDVLDHYAAHGHDLSHYLELVEERARKHGWAYRRHWLPHDARARTLATRLSVLEQCQERWPGRVAVGPGLALRDGVAATRWLLKQDSLRIHPRCSLVASPADCDGVEALRRYRREWDPERKCFADSPVHDWASHTADAFRYLATVVRYEYGAQAKDEAPRPRQGSLPAIEDEDEGGWG